LDSKNKILDQVIEIELNTKNKSIDLDNIRDIEFINSGREELLLNFLASNIISISLDSEIIIF
jgi:hypothetical protein